MEEFYDMIFKRKSMRTFNETLTLTENELIKIKQKTENLTHLDKDIRVKFKIVDRENTTAKHGTCCLLMYSEKKPLYLYNSGYLLEQMDLFLASLEIGACWYGLAKTGETQWDSFDYVIMLSFGKSSKQDFRKDASDFKRKSRDEIWQGDFNPDVIEAVRCAPSACNTQPWRFVSGGNCIKVFCTTQIRSFIPAGKRLYFNSIDMGICLCILEIALLKKGYDFKRRLILKEDANMKLIKIAEYVLK